MRKLKFHEQKLLKKTDFLQWKRHDDLREIKILRRYHIQNREDYRKYNRVVGKIAKLVNMIKTLPPTSEARIKITERLLDKLYDMGVITNRKSLAVAEKIPASAFCRRRLSVLLVSLKFVDTISDAVQFIEQGHFRVGPDPISDPAFHVTRSFEDHVQWVDTSSVRRKVLEYNQTKDDYDLMN
eukprot:c9083_g1_i1.p1 GENE.c9083_g1_i1~~c9083_g1_i1.p1  ORF type:complete len:183 (+),score=38.21 c9083_g1_i1:132-680(+)